MKNKKGSVFLICFLVAISFSGITQDITGLGAFSGDVKKDNVKLQSDSGGVSFTPNVFGVICDYGYAGEHEEAVASLVKSWNPELIITTGDNNYPTGDSLTIDTNIGLYYHQYIKPYAGIYGNGADSNRFFPSIGNHDLMTADGNPYYQYFTLPGNERYYDFISGNVHFFCLNSNPEEPDGDSDSSVQGLWLKAKLATSTQIWKIVFFHHPPFASDDVHGSHLQMRWPFKEWGADIVLSGHAHVYERVSREGFPYIVNGAGGKSLFSFISDPVLGSIFRYNQNFGALQIKASADTLGFRFYNINNQLVDSLFLSKIIMFQKEDPGKSELFVFPDPSTGVFTLRYRIKTAPDKPVDLVIADVSGKIILKKSLPANSSFIDETVGLEVDPGIYFLNVFTGGKKESRKLILIK